LFFYSCYDDPRYLHPFPTHALPISHRCCRNGPAHRERPLRQPTNESGVFLADNAGAALCSGSEIFRRNPPHSPRSLGAKPSLTVATDDGSGHTGRLDTQHRCGKSKQVRPPAAELSSTQFFVAAPHHRQISALSRDKKLKSLGVSVSTVCINNLECGIIGDFGEP